MKTLTGIILFLFWVTVLGVLGFGLAATKDKNGNPPQKNKNPDDSPQAVDAERLLLGIIPDATIGSYVQNASGDYTFDITYINTEYAISVTQEGVPYNLISKAPPGVNFSDISSHDNPRDCWIIIKHKAYDVTPFLESHPGGPSVLPRFCGKDGTEGYSTKEKTPPKPHSKGADALLKEYYLGDVTYVFGLPNLRAGDKVSAALDMDVLKSAGNGGNLAGAQSRGSLGEITRGPVLKSMQWYWFVDFGAGPDGWVREDFLKPESGGEKPSEPPPVELSPGMLEVGKHNTRADCWLVIEGKVYDVTEYIRSRSHPGGEAILAGCGKDATALFRTRPMGSNTPHSANATRLLKLYFVKDLEE